MCTKRKYSSKSIAESEAERLNLNVFVYNCKICLGWHFSKKDWRYS